MRRLSFTEVTQSQVNDQTYYDASIVVIMDSDFDFDDADVFDTVLEHLRYDPEAKRKREEEHERAKELFHKSLEPPRKKKRRKKMKIM